METSSEASKVIYGYWRNATDVIIEELVRIIIKYIAIPEHFYGYGDKLRCIENKFTIVYDWENLEERIQYQHYMPWAYTVHWPQTAYGNVKLDPSSLNANWKFEYALPQSHTQIGFIGITNCKSLLNTNPGELTHDYRNAPKWQKNDIYLGYEFAPRQKTKYEMFIENDRNKFNIKEIFYTQGGYRLLNEAIPRCRISDYSDPQPISPRDYLYGDLEFNVRYDKMHQMIIAKIDFRSWPTNCISDTYATWIKIHLESIDILDYPELFLSISIPEGGSMSLKRYHFGNSRISY